MVRVAFFFAALASAGCSDFGRRPVVTWEGESLTLEELRREIADSPASERPALSSPRERLAFVQRVLRRSLLEAELASLPDSVTAPTAQELRDRNDVLIRRLRALVGGMGDPTEDQVKDAERLSRTKFSIRRAVFTEESAARRARVTLDDGNSFASLESNSTCVVTAVETLQGWPWPLEPILEAVRELESGATSAPVTVGGSSQLVHVLERTTTPVPLDEEALIRVREGLRKRLREEKIRELESHVREGAKLEWDEAPLRALARSIGQKTLGDQGRETDAEFWIPEEFTGDQVLLRITPSMGRPDSITVADVGSILRKQTGGRRFWKGSVEGAIRRLIDLEISRRLLLHEAHRDRLEKDWWAERELRRVESERITRVVSREVGRTLYASPSIPDSLAEVVLLAQPAFGTAPARAHVLRADFSSEFTARLEFDRIQKSGGLARYAERVLAGEIPSEAVFHKTHVTAGSLSNPALEQIVLSSPPGTLVGPIPSGTTWTVVQNISFDPARTRTPEELRREIQGNLQASQGPLAFESWVQERLSALNAKIDEVVLEELAPGA